MKWFKASVEHSWLTTGCGNIASGCIVESKNNFAARKQIVDNCARQVGLDGVFR